MGIVRRLMLAGTVVVLYLLISTVVAAQTGQAALSKEQAAVSQSQPHSEQAYTLPPGKLAQAIALNKIRVSLDIAGSLWGLIVLGCLLTFGAAGWLDAWTRETTRWRWLQGVLFFAIMLAILAVANLPLDAIGHAASLRYGVSVQGWPGWMGDQGKGLAVSLGIGVPLALLCNWLVRVSPRRYWLWMWIISIPLIVIAVFLAPKVLDPLFNKFEPLEKTHPELVTKLEEVVARTGTEIPPDRMFLMKASAKTNGINAYVTGIGSSKRFVMWDTTTDRMPDDEFMFIFGHESGHYVLNHIPKMMAMMMAGLFFVIWACARLAEWLVQRFGERWHV